MGAQVCQIGRISGEVYHRGYVHDATRESESLAECVSANYGNTDPLVGYVVLYSDQEYTAADVLYIAEGPWNESLGYSVVLG